MKYIVKKNNEHGKSISFKIKNNGFCGNTKKHKVAGVLLL